MSFSGKRYSISQIQSLLRQAGWPDILVQDSDGSTQPLIVIMSAIAISESQGYAGAENYNPPIEISTGLLQVNQLAWPEYTPEQLKDPLTNLKIAYKIYQKQGFNAWGPYQTGIYSDNLPAAWIAYGGAPTPTIIDTGNVQPIIDNINNNTGEVDQGGDILVAGATSNDTLTLGLIGLAAVFVLSR